MFLDQMLDQLQYTHKIYSEIMSAEVPTYIMRYEDLKTRPVEIMREVAAFYLNVPIEEISGTIIEQRIERYCSGGFQSKAVYKMKSNTKNLCRNRDYYREEDLIKMQKILVDYLQFCGYTGQVDLGNDGTPETDFFDYEQFKKITESKKEEKKYAEGEIHKGMLNGYKRLNERTLASCGKPVEKVPKFFIGDRRYNIGVSMFFKFLTRELTWKFV